MTERRSLRTLGYALALVALCLGAVASAHATLVLGTLQSEPGVPQAGESFSLTLELADPMEVPVEDAWVLAEFRSEGAPEDAAPITTRFEETEVAGVYRTQVTLPQEGTYTLLLRDQTFRQEEARATLTFEVGRGTALEEDSFVFPPTATGSNLTTWLLWLIGLPLAAALVVTVIVLTGGGAQAEAGAVDAQKERP